MISTTEQMKYAINKQFMTYMYEHLPFRDILPIERINNNYSNRYYNPFLERVHLEIFLHQLSVVNDFEKLLIDELHYSIFKKFLDIIKNSLAKGETHVLEKKLFSKEYLYENLRHTFDPNQFIINSKDFNSVLDNIVENKKSYTQYVMMSWYIMTPLMNYNNTLDIDSYGENFKIIKDRYKNIVYIINHEQRLNDLYVFSINNNDPEIQFYYDVPPQSQLTELYDAMNIKFNLEMLFKFHGNINVKRIMIT